MAPAPLHVSVASPDENPGGTPQRGALRAGVRGLSGWLAKAAPATARGDVSVAIVSDRRMRSLNRQFRGKDAVTDVLSFPAKTPGSFFEATKSGKMNPASFLGDVVIASGVAKRQAKEAGHSIQTEVRVLALHGLLHLLGYDHDTDEGKMARVEARLRKKAGLQEGLIERHDPSTRGRSPRANGRSLRVK
ncbi:MAG: rRNA maturation RNase YbeY [Acidobacteriota bacterium]|nr:rRNA maturation RNase YbeY [Acidobacteriota bacterium]